MFSLKHVCFVGWLLHFVAWVGLSFVASILGPVPGGY